jgi:hypothetical protein
LGAVHKKPNTKVTNGLTTILELIYWKISVLQSNIDEKKIANNYLCFD